MKQVQARSFEAALDPATGLYDRRTMWTRLAEETSRSRRYRYPFALMLITVVAPERQAHSWVVYLAQILRQRTRAADIPIRYSEDTLAMLLPCTDERGALCLAERIRQLAQALPPDAAGRPLPLCIGIATQIGEYRGDKVALIEQMERAIRQAIRQEQPIVILTPTNNERLN